LGFDPWDEELKVDVIKVLSENLPDLRKRMFDLCSKGPDGCQAAIDAYRETELNFYLRGHCLAGEASILRSTIVGGPLAASRTALIVSLPPGWLLNWEQRSGKQKNEQPNPESSAWFGAVGDRPAWDASDTAKRRPKSMTICFGRQDGYPALPKQKK
jgi:hypothetical protein